MKSALTPETIWNQDQNSEDELSLVYKNIYLPEPSFEPVGLTTQMEQTNTNQDRTSGNNERTSWKKKKSTPCHSMTPKDKITVLDMDEND